MEEQLQEVIMIYCLVHNTHLIKQKRFNVMHSIIHLSMRRSCCFSTYILGYFLLIILTGCGVLPSIPALWAGSLVQPCYSPVISRASTLFNMGNQVSCTDGHDS